jgi:hypothetical protein
LDLFEGKWGSEVLTSDLVVLPHGSDAAFKGNMVLIWGLGWGFEDMVYKRVLFHEFLDGGGDFGRSSWLSVAIVFAVLEKPGV